MASNGITISTEQVAQIANDMGKMNNELTEILNETHDSIKKLGGVWSGKAAEATISTFNSFANKYFESYHELIEAYVKFLRVNVVQGYSETEEKNVALAENFK